MKGGTRNLFVLYGEAESNLLNKCIQFLLPRSNCIFAVDPTVWPIAAINQIGVSYLTQLKDRYQSSNNQNTMSICWDFFFFLLYYRPVYWYEFSNEKNQWDNETQAIRHLLVKLYRENAFSTLCFPSYLRLQKRKESLRERPDVGNERYYIRKIMAMRNPYPWYSWV